MIYLGDKEIGIVKETLVETAFSPYLVTYVEQEDGTYEMQINDYVEGGAGEKVYIGTVDRGDNLMDLYILNGERE